MANNTTLQEIINYYCNLLIIQYNKLPNANAMVNLFIEELIANGIIFDVRDGYDLETAVGKQLDVLAKYIGADRFFIVQTFENFFSFILYDDASDIYSTEIGFCDYSDLNKPGHWLTYNDIVSGTFSLADSDFRLLLKLKILQNNSNHSNKQIDDGIHAIFGDLLIPQDNYDMTMNYIVDFSIASIVDIADQKGILPKPMGVAINLFMSTG